MKKFLLSMLIFATSAFVAKIYGQYPCDGGPNNCAVNVANTVITIKSTQQNPNNAGQIIVTFDVSFDLSYNNGNTNFFIHSYLADDYPGYFPCSGGNVAAPTAVNGLGTARDQIGASFLDIELSNPARGAVGVPVNMPIATTYQYDGTVELTNTVNSPGMSATKVFLSGTTDRVTILDAVVIINAALGDVLEVKTDVWAQNGNARCWIAGIGQFFNDPKSQGLKTVTIPVNTLWALQQ